MRTLKVESCPSCSAPINRIAKSCSYCGVKLELDLHGETAFQTFESETDRSCPDCDGRLESVDLKVASKFIVERCKNCKGVFFDQGELEMILDKTVSGVYLEDEELLARLKLENQQSRSKEFKYRKCPQCRGFMRRIAFSQNSGVVVDVCSEHGFWLDEGELRQLQKWKKAGGEIRSSKNLQSTIQKKQEANVKEARLLIHLNKLLNF